MCAWSVCGRIMSFKKRKHLSEAGRCFFVGVIWMKDRILIKKALIPYSFDIALPDEVYTVTVSYNPTADLFVLGLSKNGTVICAGEPVVYGMPLFTCIAADENAPGIRIVPLDESGTYNKVTFDNLNETVFLTVEG